TSAPKRIIWTSRGPLRAFLHRNVGTFFLLWNAGPFCPLFGVRDHLVQPWLWLDQPRGFGPLWMVYHVGLYLLGPRWLDRRSLFGSEKDRDVGWRPLVHRACDTGLEFRDYLLPGLFFCDLGGGLPKAQHFLYGRGAL